MCTENVKSGPTFHLLKREAWNWRITVSGPLQLLAILCGQHKWCLVQPVPQHSQAPKSLLHISEAHPCSLIISLSIKSNLKRHSAKGESQLHLPLSCVKAWREQPNGTSENPALSVLWLTFPSKGGDRTSPVCKSYCTSELGANRHPSVDKMQICFPFSFANVLATPKPNTSWSNSLLLVCSRCSLLCYTGNFAHKFPTPEKHSHDWRNNSTRLLQG